MSHVAYRYIRTRCRGSIRMTSCIRSIKVGDARDEQDSGSCYMSFESQIEVWCNGNTPVFGTGIPSSSLGISTITKP